MTLFRHFKGSEKLVIMRQKCEVHISSRENVKQVNGKVVMSTCHSLFVLIDY